VTLPDDTKWDVQPTRGYEMKDKTCETILKMLKGFNRNTYGQ